MPSASLPIALTMTFTILSCACLLSVLGSAFGQTPRPIRTRFEYEYQVLQTLILLRINQTNLENRLHAQENTVASLKSQVQDGTTKIRNLQKTVADLQSSMTSPGSTYIRWGSTGCTANGTELVYSGYAGGSYYTHRGGAAEYICLPKDPIWGHYQDTLQNGGFVYGVEYEYNKRSNIPGFTDGALKDHDVPCAVCRSSRSTSLMIPARNKCYDGWTTEYSGYLSTDYYTSAGASEYICVDEEPEAVKGGTGNTNGKLLYLVEGRCGSLPCPPYVNGRELTCVVCTK